MPDQATTSRLATQRLLPSPSWATAGTNDAMPIIPAPSVSEPRVAARNRCPRSRSGSTSGCGTRRSVNPNPTAAATAKTPRTTVVTSRPLRPCVGAETSSVIAATSRTSPGTSMRRGSAADDSSISRPLGHNRNTARTPTTTYDARHPDPTSSTAGRSAPAVIPRPTLAPQIEVACTRCSRRSRGRGSPAHRRARPSPRRPRRSGRRRRAPDSGRTHRPAHRGRARPARRRTPDGDRRRHRGHQRRAARRPTRPTSSSGSTPGRPGRRRGRRP